MRVAIIAAMVGELKPLVNTGWKKLPSESKTIYRWTRMLNGVEWVAVCAGMGADAATRAFAAAEMDGKLDAVFSIGWAGALHGDRYPREFVIPNVIIDAKTGERFRLAEREKNVVLVTTAYVADEAEKARLAVAYDGDIVDMESATVVRLAEMRGIPVCCMKMVTDGVDAHLPNLNPFIDKMGQMQMFKFVCYIALRPQYWSSLARLGKASSYGAEYLSGAILNYMLNEQRDIDLVNQTGTVADW